MISRGSAKDSEFLKELFEPYGCKVIKTFVPVDLTMSEAHRREQEEIEKERSKLYDKSRESVGL